MEITKEEETKLRAYLAELPHKYANPIILWLDEKHVLHKMSQLEQTHEQLPKTGEAK